MDSKWRLKDNWVSLKAKSQGRHVINLDRYLEEENEEKKEKYHLFALTGTEVSHTADKKVRSMVGNLRETKSTKTKHTWALSVLYSLFKDCR